jgi:hypothetical protein
VFNVCFFVFNSRSIDYLRFVDCRLTHVCGRVFVIAVYAFFLSPLSSVSSLIAWVLSPAFSCEIYYLTPTVLLDLYSKTLTLYQAYDLIAFSMAQKVGIGNNKT